jgi:tetratricopeptide (TPR) repeat protein
MLQLAVQIEPPSSSGYYWLGRVYQQKGLEEEALRSYELAVSVNSLWQSPLEASQAYFLMGTILAARNETEHAFSAFSRAIALNPRCPDTAEACTLTANIHIGRGSLLQRQGRWQEAKVEFEQAAALDQNHGYFRVLLGQTLYHLTGSIEAAQAEFQLAIQSNAYDSEVWAGVIGLLRKEQYYDKALSYLARVPDELKTTARLLIMQGKVYYDLGRYDEAIGVLLQAAQSKPVDKIVYGLLGAAYFNLGHYLEAEQALLSAIAVGEADEASLRGLLGATYLRMGRYEEAERESMKAIGVDLSFFWAYITLGDVYCNKGQATRAVNYFERALRLGSNRMPPAKVERIERRMSRLCKD